MDLWGDVRTLAVTGTGGPKCLVVRRSVVLEAGELTSTSLGSFVDTIDLQPPVKHLKAIPVSFSGAYV
eukprot:9493805-Pyramimonas_sp.AAC.1